MTFSQGIDRQKEIRKQVSYSHLSKWRLFTQVVFMIDNMLENKNTENQ
jgi:hypothetical protein